MIANCRQTAPLIVQKKRQCVLLMHFDIHIAVVMTLKRLALCSPVHSSSILMCCLNVNVVEVIPLP